MTNIENIRQEIERLMKETEDSQFDKGKRCGLKTVLDFINSLPDNDFLDESKIASKDIEEEIDRMWLNWCEDVDYLSYLSIARYFAEWGAKHLK